MSNPKKKERHLIVKSDKSAVLSLHKWMSRKEVLEDSSHVLVFESRSAAVGIHSNLPKEIRTTCTVWALSTLERAWFVFFGDQGFYEKFTEPGPSFPPEVNQHSFEKYILRRNRNTHFYRHQEDVSVPTSEILESSLVPHEERLSVTEEFRMSPAVHRELQMEEFTPDEVPNDGLCLVGTNSSKFTKNSDVKCFLETLEKMICGIDTLETIDDTYHEMFQKIQNQIIDEEHFAEMFQLNAKDGFQVYKRLRALRLERRNVKDSIQAADYVRHVFESLDRDALQQIHDQLCLQDSRTYKLREPELFKHDIPKDAEIPSE